jgi:hypothetical protein
LLIIDEGWLVLDDATFGAQLREWLKTLRKKNASVIFATESLADIETSAIAPAILESCPTRLLLPNERALEPQIAARTPSFRALPVHCRRSCDIARQAAMSADCLIESSCNCWKASVNSLAAVARTVRCKTDATFLQFASSSAAVRWMLG